MSLTFKNICAFKFGNLLYCYFQEQILLLFRIYELFRNNNDEKNEQT